MESPLSGNRHNAEEEINTMSWVKGTIQGNDSAYQIRDLCLKGNDTPFQSLAQLVSISQLLFHLSQLYEFVSVNIQVYRVGHEN